MDQWRTIADYEYLREFRDCVRATLIPIEALYNKITVDISSYFCTNYAWNHIYKWLTIVTVNLTMEML